MITTAKSIQFEDLIKGSTFDGYQFVLKNADKSPIDLTGTTIKCDFKAKSKLGTLMLSVSDGNGITIDDAENGVFSLDEIEVVDWAVGVYYWDIKMTWVTPRTKTYIGGTIKITQNVTD